MIFGGAREALRDFGHTRIDRMRPAGRVGYGQLHGAVSPDAGILRFTRNDARCDDEAMRDIIAVGGSDRIVALAKRQTATTVTAAGAAAGGAGVIVAAAEVSLRGGAGESAGSAGTAAAARTSTRCCVSCVSAGRAGRGD